MHTTDWLNLTETQVSAIAGIVAGEFQQPFKLVSVVKRDLGHKSITHVIVKLKDGTKKAIEL